MNVLHGVGSGNRLPLQRHPNARIHGVEPDARRKVLVNIEIEQVRTNVGINHAKDVNPQVVGDVYVAFIPVDFTDLFQPSVGVVVSGVAATRLAWSR